MYKKKKETPEQKNINYLKRRHLRVSCAELVLGERREKNTENISQFI